MRVALLLILALLSLAACGPEEYSWNQRMTLVVETPDGIVTGSSVVEVNATYCPDGCGLAGDIEVSYGYRGEAAAVEVLPGRWLFALIGSPAELMYRASVGELEQRHNSRGSWLSSIPQMTEAVELTGELRPLLVTFANMEEPRSVFEVNADDLAATFGEGVSLSAIRLEVVEEPSMPRISSILPWLSTIWPNTLDGQRFRTIETDFPLANSLSANSFSTEVGR